MKKIIEQLTEWRDNIECDICSEWATKEEISKFTHQHNQISTALGILQGIKENNNIPE